MTTLSMGASWKPLSKMALRDAVLELAVKGKSTSSSDVGTQVLSVHGSCPSISRPLEFAAIFRFLDLWPPLAVDSASSISGDERWTACTSFSEFISKNLLHVGQMV